jgi:hypothetical protein
VKTTPKTQAERMVGFLVRKADFPKEKTIEPP